MADSHNLQTFTQRIHTLSRLLALDLAAIPTAPSPPPLDESEFVDAPFEADALEDGVTHGVTQSEGHAVNASIGATESSGKLDSVPQHPTTTTVEASIEYTHNQNTMVKGQQKKAKAAKERKSAQRKYRRQFKRVQRYLGLRPKLDHLIHPKYDPNVKDEDKEQAITDFEVAVKVPPIDPEEPCKFDFEEGVIIICADVEWKELSTSAITELGFAYLDTNELIGLKPGKDGINWHDKIRTRHFRINEYRHHVNNRFVQGCPDRFEFGESEFVSLSDAEKILPSCFSEPANPFPSISQMASQLTTTSTLEDRKVIFVGHDPHGDIDALRRLKFNVYNTPGLLEIIDTNHIWDVWMHDRQGRKLEAILGYFNQPAWNTHNAGNDARYAIQALLAMVVRHAEMRETGGLNTVRDAYQEVKFRRMTDPEAEAYLEEVDGWKTETNLDDPREQAKEVDGGRSEF